MMNLRTKSEELFINLYEEFGNEVEEEDVFQKVENEYNNEDDNGYWLIDELVAEGYMTQENGIFRLHM